MAIENIPLPFPDMQPPAGPAIEPVVEVASADPNEARMPTVEELPIRAVLGGRAIRGVPLTIEQQPVPVPEAPKRPLPGYAQDVIDQTHEMSIRARERREKLFAAPIELPKTVLSDRDAADNTRLRRLSAAERPPAKVIKNRRYY